MSPILLHTKATTSIAQKTNLIVNQKQSTLSKITPHSIVVQTKVRALKLSCDWDSQTPVLRLPDTTFDLFVHWSLVNCLDRCAISTLHSGQHRKQIACWSSVFVRECCDFPVTLRLSARTLTSSDASSSETHGMCTCRRTRCVFGVGNLVCEVFRARPVFSFVPTNTRQNICCLLICRPLVSSCSECVLPTVTPCSKYGRRYAFARKQKRTSSKLCSVRFQLLSTRSTPENFFS